MAIDFPYFCVSKIMQNAVNKSCLRSFTCRCFVSNKSNLQFPLEKFCLKKKNFIWWKILYSPSLTRRHSTPAQRPRPTRQLSSVSAFAKILMLEHNYSRNVTVSWKQFSAVIYGLRALEEVKKLCFVSSAFDLQNLEIFTSILVLSIKNWPKFPSLRLACKPSKVLTKHLFHFIL